MCRRTVLGSYDSVSTRGDAEDESEAKSVVSLDSDVESESSAGSVAQVEARFVGLTLTAYNLANAAARSTIAETHDEYDIVRLCEYISEHHPGVPTKVRPYLAIGVAAGAQHASGVHFFEQSHRTSRDPTKRERADVASCALSAWNMGLRIRKMPTVVRSLPDMSVKSNFGDREMPIVIDHESPTGGTTVSSVSVTDDILARAIVDSGIQAAPSDITQMESTSSVIIARPSSNVVVAEPQCLLAENQDVDTSGIESSAVESFVGREKKSLSQKAATVVISGGERKVAESYLHDETDIVYGCGDIGVMKTKSSPVRTSSLYQSVKKRSPQDKDTPQDVVASDDACLAVRRKNGVVEVLRVVADDTEDIAQRKEAVKRLREQKINTGYIPKCGVADRNKAAETKEVKTTKESKGEARLKSGKSSRDGASGKVASKDVVKPVQCNVVVDSGVKKASPNVPSTVPASSLKGAVEKFIKFGHGASPSVSRVQASSVSSKQQGGNPITKLQDLKKEIAKNVTGDRQELFGFEMSPIPMIMDLDNAGTGEEEPTKKTTNEENRPVKLRVKEIVKLPEEKPVQTKISLGDGELREETQPSLDREKEDSCSRQRKVDETGADRTYGSREPRSQVEKCELGKMSPRTKSMSPDLCRPVIRSREWDERRSAVAVELQSSRCSEDPNEYRGRRNQFEYTESRHSYSDREIQTSSSNRSRREEPSLRGRPSERFDTRTLQGSGQRDFLLPPPCTYFGMRQPADEPAWSRRDTYAGSSESYRSRSPVGRRRQQQQDPSSSHLRTGGFLTPQEMQEFDRLRELEYSRQQSRRSEYDDNDEY